MPLVVEDAGTCVVNGESGAFRHQGTLRHYLPLAALVGWLALFAGVRVLTLPEEARYVSVALAMARSGDWLTPTLNGMPFFDKPPLFYWIEASALSLVGGIQWSARVAPLLGATVGAASLWHLVRRRANVRVGGWTLLVLATLPLFFGGAQFANLDMLAAGCIALTICLAAQSLWPPHEEAPSRRLIAALWASAAAGVLAKGLIGIVVPGLVVVAWALATRRARSLRALVWPPAIALFLVLAVPWFATQELLHPGFARYFFIHQHVERFAGSGFNNARGWWFYLAVTPLLTLPWCLWLLRTWWSPKSEQANDAKSMRSLMWIWLATVVVFFSIPQSKPIGYMMPALFPLAFLAADAVCGGSVVGSRLATVTAGIAATASLAYVLLSGVGYDRDNRMLGQTLGLLRQAGDPVTFAGDYYYDVPIYARLVQPVRVTGRWADPDFAKNDDWRGELAAAAAFAPEQAKAVLVDLKTGFEAPCDHPLWVIARADERPPAKLPRADRILESNGAILWRIAARACTP